MARHLFVIKHKINAKCPLSAQTPSPRPGPLARVGSLRVPSAGFRPFPVLCFHPDTLPPRESTTSFSLARGRSIPARCSVRILSRASRRRETGPADGSCRPLGAGCPRATISSLRFLRIAVCACCPRRDTRRAFLGCLASPSPPFPDSQSDSGVRHTGP